MSWLKYLINKCGNTNASRYTIDPAWLNRVEEVVNYALNAYMYVIMNEHWDGGW